MDMFPVLSASPREDGYSQRQGYYLCVLPVSRPDSPVAATLGLLLEGATGLFGSVMGSPATSLSLMEQAEHLNLLSQPLTPLAVVEMSEANHERAPTTAVVPPPAAYSQEGPFDAAAEPAVTGGYPVIRMNVARCPYRITTFRMNRRVICTN